MILKTNHAWTLKYPFVPIMKMKKPSDLLPASRKSVPQEASRLQYLHMQSNSLVKTKHARKIKYPFISNNENEKTSNLLSSLEERSHKT